jgi:ubiquinone biosynthesis protein COQ9
MHGAVPAAVFEVYGGLMMDAAAPPDWADQTEQRLLDAALPLAPDLGWTASLVQRAARSIGLSAADAELLVPHGAKDLAALLGRRFDDQAIAALADVDPAVLKMRERIIRAAQAWIKAAAAEPAARRWTGFLALPFNAPLGLRLAWDTADRLWRWAGDRATDENHYSKRAILAGILITALPIRLTAGEAAAERYLYDRVANVMAFEAWKGGLPPHTLGPKLAEALGRMRYGRP